MEKINKTPKNLAKNYRIKQRTTSEHIISNYKLNQTIGIGGFAKVKKAYHIPTGQIVAVKIYCKSQLSPDILKRVVDQIQMQKDLHHQGIAKIYQVIIKHDKIYIFMEYISNGQLFQYLNKKGPLKLQRAMKIFCQLLQTLNYLNQKGICHRDIKTENILLDEKLNPKIIDFGLSKKYKNSQRLNTYCGSPSYVPPQIVLKKNYKPQKVDIWSLGVVLYALLTAQLPFQEYQNKSLQSQIINKNYQIKLAFPQEIKNIFSSIFQYEDHRITLQGLLETQYIKKQVKKIQKTKLQKILDQNVINNIAKQHNIDPRSVKISIVKNNYDWIHAQYYLMLKNSGAKSSQSSETKFFSYDVQSALKKTKYSESVSKKTRQSGSQKSYQKVQDKVRKLQSQKTKIIDFTSLGLSLNISKKIQIQKQKLPLSSRIIRKDTDTCAEKPKKVSIFKRLYNKKADKLFIDNSNIL